MILIGIIHAVKSDSRVTGDPIFKTDENRELYQLFLFFEVIFEAGLLYLDAFKDLF